MSDPKPKSAGKSLKGAGGDDKSRKQTPSKVAATRSRGDTKDASTKRAAGVSAEDGRGNKDHQKKTCRPAGNGKKVDTQATAPVSTTDKKPSQKASFGSKQNAAETKAKASELKSEGAVSGDEKLQSNATDKSSEAKAQKPGGDPQNAEKARAKKAGPSAGAKDVNNPGLPRPTMTSRTKPKPMAAKPAIPPTTNTATSIRALNSNNKSSMMRKPAEMSASAGTVPQLGRPLARPLKAPAKSDTAQAKTPASNTENVPKTSQENSKENPENSQTADPENPSKSPVTRPNQPRGKFTQSARVPAAKQNAKTPATASDNELNKTSEDHPKAQEKRTAPTTSKGYNKEKATKTDNAQTKAPVRRPINHAQPSSGGANAATKSLARTTTSNKAESKNAGGAKDPEDTMVEGFKVYAGPKAGGNKGKGVAKGGKATEESKNEGAKSRYGRNVGKGFTKTEGSKIIPKHAMTNGKGRGSDVPKEDEVARIVTKEQSTQTDADGVAEEKVAKQTEKTNNDAEGDVVKNTHEKYEATEATEQDIEGEEHATASDEGLGGEVVKAGDLDLAPVGVENDKAHPTLPPTVQDDLPDRAVMAAEGDLPDVAVILAEGGLPDLAAMAAEGDLPDLAAMAAEDGLPDLAAVAAEGDLPDIAVMVAEGGLPDLAVMAAEGDLPDLPPMEDDTDLPNLAIMVAEGGLPDLAVVAAEDDLPYLPALGDETGHPDLAETAGGDLPDLVQKGAEGDLPDLAETGDEDEDEALDSPPPTSEDDFSGVPLEEAPATPTAH